MSNRDKAWNKLKWKFIKKRLGYSDEQMVKFRSNPKNEDILDSAPEVQKKMIVAEVIDSQGCNSQHKTGDKFYFDGAGNLISKMSPEKICVFALHAITMQIFTAGELICAGVDPNKMRFNKAACFDVGVECGGWGRVVMEIQVEDLKNHND